MSDQRISPGMLPSYPGVVRWSVGVRQGVSRDSGFTLVLGYDIQVELSTRKLINVYVPSILVDPPPRERGEAQFEWAAALVFTESDWREARGERSPLREILDDERDCIWTIEPELGGPGSALHRTAQRFIVGTYDSRLEADYHSRRVIHPATEYAESARGQLGDSYYRVVEIQSEAFEGTGLTSYRYTLLRVPEPATSAT